MFFLKIIYAILFFLAWYLSIKYRKNVKSWTGNFYWAEKYIWNWWTYIIIILFGILLMIVWIIYPFWWIELFFPKKIV